MLNRTNLTAHLGRNRQDRERRSFLDKKEKIQIETGDCQGEMYWAWLCSIPGLYLPQQKILLQYLNHPEAVWKASQKELEALGREGYEWAKKVSWFQKKSTPVERMHILGKRGIRFISFRNPGYPMRLRTLSNAPLGLFYKGSLPEEQCRAAAIVGARMCSRFGKDMAELIAGMIVVYGGQVISGAAYGIDGVAQMEALRRGGRSYGILGCGVDVCYPKGNYLLFEQLEKQGGIISEFPPGTPPLRSHFPMRNRLISGMSDMVIVVEARKKSGSLITADFAAEQGREVYAVPGRPGEELSEGCNELISQGAGIFLSPEQFAESVLVPMGMEKSKKSLQVTLAPSEELVYSSLGLHSKGLIELQECTDMSLTELSDILLRLELKGLVRETSRNFYAKMK